MNVYQCINRTNIDQFATYLRRRGYAAYIEQDGKATLLVTNYQPTGKGFLYVGPRI